MSSLSAALSYLRSNVGSNCVLGSLKLKLKVFTMLKTLEAFWGRDSFLEYQSWVLPEVQGWVMDIEALASLESQKRFCEELVQNVVKNESFILLAGDTGSGRTVICEQLVNETDSRMRAVFIPCHKDMPLQRLRELFLQQLLPSSEFDPDLNLVDALDRARIPYNHKILVVVDDADTVISSFYNELLALYEHFLGQGRFSFVLVGHPLWAEEKVSRPTSRADVELMRIPTISLAEALLLSRHMFAVQNSMRVYKAISNRLPDALSNAKGNLNQIIAITEKLMKDPTSPEVTNEKGGKLGKDRNVAAKPKKSSSVGIFVTVVCIIIVLACLIPIFLGGSFFSDDKSKAQAQSQVANGDALVLGDSDKLLNDAGALPDSIPGGIDAETVKKQTEHSVTLSGEQLEKIEGRANSSDYPRRVGGSVSKEPTVVTLRRADNINHVATASTKTNTAIDMPPAAKPVMPTAQQLAAQQKVMSEADQALANIAKQAQAPVAQASAPTQQLTANDKANLQSAAQKKLEADRAAAKRAAEAEKRAANAAAVQAAAQSQRQTAQAAQTTQQGAAQAAKQAAQQQAAQVPPRPALKAGQVISLAEEARQQQAARRNNAATQAPAANANAGAGSHTAAIRALNGNHYTVQIVSASNRANVAAAARALNTSWWIVDSNRNGRPWYILIAGDYATREDAMAAARNIPRSVSQGATPFAKRISEAQAEIR